jgi:hypothetical protein
MRSLVVGDPKQPPVSLQAVENIYTFVRAQRLHQVRGVCSRGRVRRRGRTQLLVARYNPAGDLTADERIKATARRVGLNVPVEYDAEFPSKLPDGNKDPDKGDK